MTSTTHPSLELLEGDDVLTTSVPSATPSGILVLDRVEPSVAEWFDSGRFPRDLAREIADMYLLRMRLDGYGCARTNETSDGVACRELEAGDGGISTFVCVQASLTMFPIHHYGSDELNQRWLPDMAAGEIIGAVGLGEPDSGSRLGSTRTPALTVTMGSSTAPTFGSPTGASVASRSSGRGPTTGVRDFLVPSDRPGHTIRDVPAKLSSRAPVTSEPSFESCRLPADAMLLGARTCSAAPVPQRGAVRDSLGWLRCRAALYRGGASLCVQSRAVQSPDREYQLTQRKLVDLVVADQLAALVIARLGCLKDAGRITSQQGSLDKLHMSVSVGRRGSHWESRTILGTNRGSPWSTR